MFKRVFYDDEWTSLGRLAVAALVYLATSIAADARAPTVADSIAMWTFGSTFESVLGRSPVVFSPDRTSFAIVVHAGDLSDNSNIFKLLLFRVGRSSGKFPATVLRMTKSRSNTPGISSVRWSTDGKSVFFLGLDEHGISQLCALVLATGRQRYITHHSTDVVDYAANNDATSVIFLARPPLRPIATAAERANGLVLTSESFPDLMMGHGTAAESGFLFSANPFQVFVQTNHGAERHVGAGGAKPQEYGDIALSPDGRFAVVRAFSGRRPEIWRQYQVGEIASAMSADDEIYQLLLVDLSKGNARPLLNAPQLAMTPSAHWIGRTVVVTGTLLPLDRVNSSEHNLRAKYPFAVEIDPLNGRTTKLSRGLLEYRGWNGERLLFQETNGRLGQNRVLGPLRCLQRSDRKWTAIVTACTLADDKRGADVRVLEDSNHSPKLYAVNRTTNEKILVFDPNPQLAQLDLATVTEISWRNTDGTKSEGGLYSPNTQRFHPPFPLVIQTHGWDHTKFWMDGPSNAGYAAQALAGSGIAVVQLEDDAIADETVRENSHAAMTYDGLIDRLTAAHLVDAGKVGILGWSRTGGKVRYALEFGRHKYQAAVLADAGDISYFNYIESAGQGYSTLLQKIIGARPFGKQLNLWLQRASGFNLDRVTAPVRIIGFSAGYSIVTNWEWYSGLKQLGRPVEFLWLPDAEHSPLRPLERIAAQQGDVDWFRFWLQHFEDRTSSKRAQYSRWRGLQRNL